jgi:hypothetical protein
MMMPLMTRRRTVPSAALFYAVKLPLRNMSLQRKEWELKEESYQQQLSLLSSNKSQLESDWMAKCDEIQQRCREELEDMEYQLETKGEELYIAKQIASEMERKV